MIHTKRKIRFAFNLLSALLIFTSIKAQTENQDFTATEDIRNMEMPVEKVYLHTDRPYYFAGDDIWFKAYLVDGFTNKLSDKSNNLNVELISAGSKIIKRLILRIDKGLCIGDFHLNDSIASGNYLIRAYTNWMRNFGEVFFFEKEIVIENQIGLKALHQLKPEENKEMIDVQFFPEGGPLIENINTILGFKAINAYGYGCNVKGKVISSLGDSVASFSSIHLGMGSFTFTSKKGLNYYAIGFSENGIPFKVKLPDAIKTGYSLKVSDIDNDFFNVAINTNQETLNQFPFQELVIVGTVHNSLCATVQYKVKDITNTVYMLKNEFPDGIARITLMDTTGTVFCERVFYIRTKENYKICIVPDNKLYVPRQKVTLQISVKDTSNNPVPAYLSVSVVDGNQVKDLEKKSCISSYLLLESEIRGNIEQPFYYFDTTVSNRYKALDDLLLTQGWRNYIWNYLSDTILKFNFPEEDGITVSGRFRHKLTGKPIANTAISLALEGDDMPFYGYANTDSTGRYHFDGLNFAGPRNIVVSASDEKSQRQGLILIDSIQKDPAPLNNSRIYKTATISKEIDAFKKEAEQKYNILKKYNITDTIFLDEVTIKARKLQKENADGHFRVYGNADYSLTITDKMLSNRDIFQTLQGRVAGLMIIEDPINGYRVFFARSGYYQNYGDATPLFLIDGRETDLGQVMSLPMSAVDKIEVLKDIKTTLYGFRGSFGVINILTKRGIINPWEPVLYSINQQVYGYYQARTFYTPKYNTRQPENEKPDLRTTIHWEPNVVTDIDGNATVSFFNADNKADIIVDVQGIAEFGNPLTGKTSFEVK